MKCKLVPVDDRVWQLYSSWHAHRGLPAPVPGAYAWVFLAAQLPQGPTLVSGAMVVQHLDDLILDRFMANPEVSARTVHSAAVMTVNAARTLSTLLGKRLLEDSDEPSVQRMLARMGWVMFRNGPLMVADPGLEFTVPDKTKAPSAGGAPRAPSDARERSKPSVSPKTVEPPAPKGKAAIAAIRRQQLEAEAPPRPRAKKGKP